MGNRDKIHISGPPYQFKEWREEAEREDISRSEWIRYRVEAGRKQLADLDPQTDDTTDGGLRTTVLDSVPEGEAVATDEIVTTVLGPLEDEIYDILEELNDAGEIGYDPREGGYRKR